MNQQRGESAQPIESSISPTEGWHCSHLYYRFDRSALAQLNPATIEQGAEQMVQALDPAGSHAPLRLQVTVTSGHKADFGLMLMDPDPLKIDAVHQELATCQLGPALQSTYSFVSLSEVSEYVPTEQQYREKLIRIGEQPDSPAFNAKVKAYAGRLPAMNRQRLTPEFPDWPVTCFYPMNKKRKVGENWFLLPFSARNQMMAEHARSGMGFMGKVSQLITVGIGLDDWEWGVTLWARNPEFLKEIVYQMRFDEASARYAEFGPFLTGYVTSPSEMLKHCRILR